MRADRHCPGAASWLERAFEEGPREFFEIERVALCLANQPSAREGVEPVADDPCEHLLRRGVCERAECQLGRPVPEGRRARSTGARHPRTPESAPRSGRVRPVPGPWSSSTCSARRRVGASAHCVSSIATMTGFADARRSSRRTKAALASSSVAGVASRRSRSSAARAENGLGLVTEQRSESGASLRSDGDLGLADLGTEPAEEDLDEWPAREGRRTSGSLPPATSRRSCLRLRAR